MWKYIPTLDEDKDAGTVTAQLIDDNTKEVVFQYSERVSLYDTDSIRSFIKNAKTKADERDLRIQKIADYITAISNEETVVDAAIVAEKAAVAEAVTPIK